MTLTVGGEAVHSLYVLRVIGLDEYISSTEITRRMHAAPEDRRFVTLHLGVLAKYGFVERSQKTENRRLELTYRRTAKGEKALEALSALENILTPEE